MPQQWARHETNNGLFVLVLFKILNSSGKKKVEKKNLFGKLLLAPYFLCSNNLCGKNTSKHVNGLKITSRMMISCRSSSAVYSHLMWFYCDCSCAGVWSNSPKVVLAMLMFWLLIPFLRFLSIWSLNHSPICGSFFITHHSNKSNSSCSVNY